MDHDAAREWIDGAVLAQGAHDDPELTGAAPEARGHIAACPECAAYETATQRAALKLDLARGPSPDARTRLLASARRLKDAREVSAPPAPAQPWWQRPLAWRFAAAALVLALVGAAGGAWWAGNARPDNDADRLSAAVAMMSDLASSAGAQELVLRDATGARSGFAVISAASHQMAVFATHIASGVGYHCYVERAGQRTWIGSMYATLGVEFWAGDMDPGIEMQPGDILVVAADPNQPAVLSAPL